MHLDNVASHFGTTVEVVYANATVFFEMLERFRRQSRISDTERNRWLRSLFCVGATSTIPFLQSLDAKNRTKFSDYVGFSPQLRSLACNQPNELSFLLKREPAWVLNHSERRLWDAYYNKVYCARLRWLARVALSPWNPVVFLPSPVSCRRNAVLVGQACIRSGCFVRPAVLRILWLMGYLKFSAIAHT